jgi:hypothetical protein
LAHEANTSVRGCIMYSYTFHIMKYYFCGICFIFCAINIFASAVKDFAWPGQMTATSYSPDT